MVTAHYDPAWHNARATLSEDLVLAAWGWRQIGFQPVVLVRARPHLTLLSRKDSLIIIITTHTSTTTHTTTTLLS